MGKKSNKRPRKSKEQFLSRDELEGIFSVVFDTKDKVDALAKIVEDEKKIAIGKKDLLQTVKDSFRVELFQNC